MNHQAFEAALVEMKTISAEMRKLTSRSVERLTDIDKDLCQGDRTPVKILVP